MFCTFAGMMSLTLNSKLCNFIISWNLTKTQQSFVQDSFSIKLTKAYLKKTGESKLQFFINIKKKDKREKKVIKKITN